MLHNFITLLIQEPTFIYCSICTSGAWVGLLNFQYSLCEDSQELNSSSMTTGQSDQKGRYLLEKLPPRNTSAGKAAGSVCGTILWEKQLCCGFASINLTKTSLLSWPGKTKRQQGNLYQGVREEKASALPEDSCHCQVGRPGFGAGTSDVASPISPSFPSCNFGCLSRVKLLTAFWSK